MERIKLEKNKSSTYLLPIFGKYINISYFRLLKNTYLWYDDPAEDSFCLLYEFDGRVKGEMKSRFGFTVYEERTLRSSVLFMGSEDYGRYVIFQFSLPDEMFEVRDLFIQGKYSAYTPEHKNLILEFIMRYYGPNEKNYINRILNKDPLLREEILQALGPHTKMDKNAELSSSPYLEKELFANCVEFDIQKQGEENETKYLL